ncbi:MAG: hypothetical protein AB7U79_04885 [Candidatus Izemoplasmatales bacterium]
MDVITELKEAVKHYQVRQYDLALPIFKKYAKLKDPQSMYYLGLMSYYGNGLKQNSKDAYLYFVKAKEERIIDASYMIGLMYELGQYVEQNYEQAYQFYQAAFHEGHSESGIKIAYFYEQGYFVEKNMKKAIETYVECAKKDHPYALYKIGKAYLTGEGIRKSTENAHVWLNKALLQGSTDAMNEFRLLGSKSSSDIRTKEQLFSIGMELVTNKREEDAFIYFEIASNEGHNGALHQLIDLMKSSQNINYEKYFELLETGAKRKDGYSIFLLGKAYEQGQGCLSSLLKAESFYLKAIECEYTEATSALKKIRGDIYER